MKTLLQNGTIIPMSDSEPRIIQGDIAVSGDTITQIADRIENFQADRVLDCSGRIIVPGFINAHTHLAMTLLRNYYDDMDLYTWLNDYIWPVEEKLTPEAVYRGSQLGVIESIRSGVTYFADMYFEQEQTIQAVAEGGIRAHIGATFMGDDSATRDRLPHLRDIIETWNGSHDGRISFDAAPHAIYTCSKGTLQAARDLAEEYGLSLHIHMAESEKEAADSMAEHGMTPFAYLDSIDFFSRPAYAAHCIYMEESDIQLCRDRKISIVHNPSSNLKLGNGIAPVQSFLNAGINVAMGTDGASSNNNLNLMEEMHIASLIAKGFTKDPTALNAYQTLRAATMGGAEALNESRRIGSLEPGKSADLVIIDTSSAHMTPKNNPISAVVYSAQAADIEAVMCRGKFLMQDSKLTELDEEEIIRKTEEAAGELLHH